jgi:hypothetical protein
MPEAREAARQFLERSRAIRRYCSFLRDAIRCIAIQAPEHREEYADEGPQDAEEEKADPQNCAARSPLAGSEVYEQQQSK